MKVNSTQLDVMADRIRRRKRPLTIAGIRVSAAQLEAAARLLREAEPSVVTHMTRGGRRRRVNLVSERPGFIDPEAQAHPNVLVFEVGIFGTEYRIGRRGVVQPEETEP